MLGRYILRQATRSATTSSSRSSSLSFLSKVTDTPSLCRWPCRIQSVSRMQHKNRQLQRSSTNFGLVLDCASVGLVCNPSLFSSLHLISHFALLSKSNSNHCYSSSSPSTHPTTQTEQSASPHIQLGSAPCTEDPANVDDRL